MTLKDSDQGLECPYAGWEVFRKGEELLECPSNPHVCEAALDCRKGVSSARRDLAAHLVPSLVSLGPSPLSLRSTLACLCPAPGQEPETRVWPLTPREVT